MLQQAYLQHGREPLFVPYPEGFSGKKSGTPEDLDFFITSQPRFLTNDEIAIAQAFLKTLFYRQQLILTGAVLLDTEDPLLTASHDEFDEIENRLGLPNSKYGRGGIRQPRERAYIIRERVITTIQTPRPTPDPPNIPIAYDSDPNAIVISRRRKDLCIDVINHHLYQAEGINSLTWTQIVETPYNDATLKAKRFSGNPNGQLMPIAKYELCIDVQQDRFYYGLSVTTPYWQLINLTPVSPSPSPSPNPSPSPSPTRTPSPSPSPTPSAPSLFAHWTLEGSPWIDLVGGKTLTNAGSGTVASIAGVDGNAASFPGNGWLTRQDNSLSLNSGSWEITCHIYLTTFTAGKGLIHVYSSNYDEFYLETVTSGGNKLRFEVLDENYEVIASVISGIVTTGAWYFVKIGVDLNSNRAYLTLDGNETSTNLTGTPVSSGSGTIFLLGLKLGSPAVAGTRMDDVKVFK